MGVGGQLVYVVLVAELERTAVLEVIQLALVLLHFFEKLGDHRYDLLHGDILAEFVSQDLLCQVAHVCN